MPQGQITQEMFAEMKRFIQDEGGTMNELPDWVRWKWPHVTISNAGIKQAYYRLLDPESVRESHRVWYQKNVAHQSQPRVVQQQPQHIDSTDWTQHFDSQKIFATLISGKTDFLDVNFNDDEEVNEVLDAIAGCVRYAIELEIQSWRKGKVDEASPGDNPDSQSERI